MIRELKEENDKLRRMLLQAAQGNGTINLNDLGMGSANDILETLDHAEEEIEELETDFDQKLKEQKEADRIKDE